MSLVAESFASRSGLTVLCGDVLPFLCVRVW